MSWSKPRRRRGRPVGALTRRRRWPARPVAGNPHRPTWKRCSGAARDRFRRWMPGLRGGAGPDPAPPGGDRHLAADRLLPGRARRAGGRAALGRSGPRPPQPGLNYHLPWPFETVIRPKVTKINRAEIGYRTLVDSQRGAFTRPVPDESLMLTGDENIIDVKFTVFWRIRDAGASTSSTSRRLSAR